jgi:hypothetical protein
LRFGSCDVRIASTSDCQPGQLPFGQVGMNRGSVGRLQVTDPAAESIPPFRLILAGGVNLLTLPDAPDITYYGIRAELPLSDRLSYSGSIYIGSGSDGLTYAHLPLAGFVISIPYLAWLGFLEWLSNEPVPPAPEWFKYLLLENLHLNIRAGERAILSPYLSLLSVDGEVRSGVEESTEEALSVLTAGIGLTGKLSLSDRLVIVPDFSVRRYFFPGDDYGGNDRFGANFGVHLGVVF